MRVRKNPVKRDPKYPKKPVRSRVVSEYLDPLKNLRKIGIDPAPGFNLRGVRTVQQIPPKVRAAIVREYDKYDDLFSRPHIVADFSLGDRELRDEYKAWKAKAEKELRKDGYTKREITTALRGTQAEYAKRRRKQLDYYKVEAQKFGGMKVDRKLSGAVIPVISGEPDKVKLRFDEFGRPYLRERSGVETVSVAFDPMALARGKRKYLEKVLAPYAENDRFFIMMGDAMSLKYSSTKTRVIEQAMRLLNRYQGAKVGEHHWKHWMLGMRVLTGDASQQAKESARQRFAALKREMREREKAEKDKLDIVKQTHKRKQARARQKRKYVRDHFIN